MVNQMKIKAKMCHNQIILDSRRGVLITPLDASVDYRYEPATSRARYLWGLHLWKREWKKAEEAQDYYRMDILHRDFEWLGLP
jgi:hypothetical protein